MSPAKKTKTARICEIDAQDARSRIFDAAVKEFAVHGLALLFYYFKSKEELYSAVLEEMFSGWNATLLKPLHSSGAPESRMLRFVEAYFDHVAASVWRPRLVQQELMRSKHSPAIRRLLKKYAKPVHDAVIQVLREGIASGKIRASLDVENFYYSITGIVAQYFSNSSAILEISESDPLSPERIHARRAAVLDVITAAMLTGKRETSRD